MSQTFHADDLQVVFITYNRSHLLGQTFARIRNTPGLSNVRVLCSDDGSSPEHQQAIAAMGFDEVVWAPKNGGLGRNNNKGLRACTSKYQLMVQDDCMLARPQGVLDAVTILEADPSVGMVRLNGDPSFFPLLAREVNGVKYWVADHTAAAYLAQKPTLPRRRVYSDQPHVRRKALHEDGVGYYAEGVPMEKTERDYEDRMDAQSKFFVAFLHPKEINTFDHLEHGESIRMASQRNRMDGWVHALVLKLNLRNLWFYKGLRAAYRLAQDTLERMGVLR